MGANSHISWCDDTWNPWIGCMKVGPACDGCYAEALMGQTGRMKRVEWGAPGVGVGTRVRTAPANWAKPLKWNREQEAFAHNSRLVGEVAPARFVFCASLADVFDNAVDPAWRRDLFDLIRATPHLTWLLLTKRPGNIVKLFKETLPDLGERDEPPHHYWPMNAAVGCTVVTQEEADRDVPHLLAAKVALKPAFAFLSMEPLLGPVDLTRVSTMRFRHAEGLNALTGELSGIFGEPAGRIPALDWVITGGETDQGGHKARPSHPNWFRSLRDQCAVAGVAYHHKQNGEWMPVVGDDQRAYPHAVARSDSHSTAWPDGTVGSGDFRANGGLGLPLLKIGKRHTGRLLDAALHDARPEVR